LQTLQTYTDDKLIELTLAGEPRSYEVLVRRYTRLVFNIAFQIVKEEGAAADVTQETFLKAYKALARFRIGQKFKPWLLRIATNSALNVIRASAQYSSLDDLLLESPADEPRSKEDIEGEVESKMLQEELSRVLASLKPIHRHIFLLRYQYDLSYEEIAEVMNEPVSTIKSLLFRARTAVRERFKEMPEASGPETSKPQASKPQASKEDR
jgi:RNA polymerase sigma-70 factor, ECF subfamily